MEDLKNQIYSKTGESFPMQLVLKVVGYSSSTWYEKPKNKKRSKPGPKPAIDDTEALALIKEDLKTSKFNGEGYLKVKKRLARSNKNIAKHRVNSLMRDHDLLSPHRPVSNGRKRTHDGKITTEEPDKMWATDGKKFWAGKDGWCWFFGVIDHFNDEIISWNAAKKGNRFEALAPVQRAVRMRFGSLDKNVCRGAFLQLRSDHGTQYESRDFLNEMNFLGLDLSKAYVRSPECNGIIERFHRTLNEQVFQINNFSSLEDAKVIINEFINNYNEHWMLHRLNLCSPLEARENYQSKTENKAA